MHWDDLRIFLAVARAGSISGAAKRLDVQHSTVSRRLRALEERLGARLLERRKSGYVLTDAGEELRVSASRMELEFLRIEGALSSQDCRLAGELHVSAINNMASSVLMPMFASFSKRHPEIRLHVEVSNRYVSLAERQADVAIRLTNTPLETLIGVRVTTVASTVYGERAYLRALRAAGGEPEWLGVECCGFHKSWTQTACPEYEHRFFVDDTLLTVAALRQGLGLAYLPCFMGDGVAELERFCVPDPDLDLGLWLLFHPDLRRTRRVVAFREHMMSEVTAQSAAFEGRIPSCRNGASG